MIRSLKSWPYNIKWMASGEGGHIHEERCNAKIVVSSYKLVFQVFQVDLYMLL